MIGRQIVIENYLDSESRVTHWPARKRREARLMILRYLAEKFEFGQKYSEKQVNEIIKVNHLFNDHALMRRELVDAGLMGRVPDGSVYWRIEALVEQL